VCACVLCVWCVFGVCVVCVSACVRVVCVCVWCCLCVVCVCVVCGVCGVWCVCVFVACVCDSVQIFKYMLYRRAFNLSHHLSRSGHCLYTISVSRLTGRSEIFQYLTCLTFLKQPKCEDTFFYNVN
jgi:hypothetical protein